MTTTTTTNKLPADPDKMNDKRAEWAGAALQSIASATGCDVQHEALGDLLANLMHWCDRNDKDFDDTVAHAWEMYADETRAAP